MYSPDSAFTGRHPVVGAYPSGMNRARSNEQFDFVLCFSQHIFDYEKAGKKGSAANYRASFRLMLSYLNGMRLTPRQFTVRWVERYERWLRARGVSANTVIFHLRNLRAVYNRAVRKRLIPASHVNPFGQLTVRQTATRKRALSRANLKRIVDLDLSSYHPKYALARDIFLFSFFTRGMSFVDMCYLRTGNIRNGVLTYVRHKTGQTLLMSIEPQLQRLIDRYRNASPYILPILAKDDSYTNYRQQQRELNKFIRKIGVLLNLPEPLTFYVARHSWATLARDCGTPLTVISAGMGHTSERTTRIYLTQLDHNIIDRANRKIIDL